jgi:hypothetical protein
MNLVSLRMMAVGASVISLVGIIGACGSSGTKVGDNNFGSDEAGAPFVCPSGWTCTQNGQSAASNTNTGGSQSPPATTTATNNPPPPATEAGAAQCPSSCTQDTDCSGCGVPSDGGVYCCGAGVCFPNPSDVCDDEGGASGDDSSAAPMSSM